MNFVDSTASGKPRCAVTIPWAAAMTRSPLRAWLSTTARMRLRSWSVSEQRCRTVSGAPLMRIRLSSANRWSVAMNPLSDPKGMSSRRGRRLRSSVKSSPPFPAATTRAASVGSPEMNHSPPSARIVASLQRRAQVNNSSSSGVSVAGQ